MLDGGDASYDDVERLDEEEATVGDDDEGEITVSVEESPIATGGVFSFGNNDVATATRRRPWDVGGW